jgi:hypothetical protein
MDLCSGWAPKITLALFYSDYDGEAILFDQDKKSMTLLRNFMRLFNPKFSLKSYHEDFFNYQGLWFDFVIANHVIDDLILEYYCRTHAIPSKNIYKQEWMVVSLWGKIIKEEGFFEEIVTVFTKQFSNLINSGGLLCFAQYKSMIEWLLSLDTSVEYNIQIMREVSRRLEHTGNFSFLNEVPKKAFRNKKTAFSPDECIILKRL